MDRETFFGVLSFVGERHKEEGGYGATPLLPATVEDTYHVLRILETLGRIRSLRRVAACGRQEGSLENYLAKVAEMSWVSARTTFQALYCLSVAGLSLDRERARDFIERTLKKSGSLVERYYCARILREILNVRDMRNWKKARMFRFSKWRTASELWMKLYLQQGPHLDDPLRRERLVAWLQACQNSDGGFGFLPGTTSFIENCHTCIRALALLNSKPLDVEACLHFVLASRTGNGGFARNIGAAPFLDATWHALAVVSSLEAL